MTTNPPPSTRTSPASDNTQDEPTKAGDSGILTQQTDTPGDDSQGNNSQGGSSPAGNSQADHDQGDKNQGQGGNEQTNKGQGDSQTKGSANGNDDPKGNDPSLSKAIPLPNPQGQQTAAGPSIPTVAPDSEPDTFAVNGITFSRGSGAGLVIGTQTVIPGANAITISGTPISLPAAGNAVVVGGSTVPIPTPELTAPPTPGLLTVDGFTFSRGPGSDIILSSQTLTPGAPALIISGTPISLLPSGTAVAVGSNIVPIPSSGDSAASLGDILTIDGFTFTRGPNSDVVLNGQTITPGAPALTISGTPVSLLPFNIALVIGSSTYPIPTAVTPAPGLFTVDGLTFSRDPKSNLVLNGQTITPGAPAITVSGETISLLPSGNALAIDGATFPVPIPASATPLPTSAPDLLTIDGFTFSRDSKSDLILNGQTISPGAPAITISGTPISLLPFATAVVINGVTDPISAATAPPVLDLDGQSYTEISGSELVIGSQTLVAGGPAITADGTALSLAPGATALEVGTSIERLSTSVGLGGMVMSGVFSGVPAPAGATGVAAAGVEASNVGSRGIEGRMEWVLDAGLLVVGVIVLLL
ncbi:MAG: hypothetical protein LQ352_001182 [Teloschistes flavicans]|nr:MAG: hypothetical protein LQ352_001182 [Teloschistes flavicans]